VSLNAHDLLAIVGTALGVFVPKALPLLLVGDRLGRRTRRWLRYVAPAVLSALVAPGIFVPGATLTLPGWELLGYAAALVVALATRRMLPSLGVGLAVVVLVTLARA
jgi:branched-subunit amino acid transport protein